MRVVLRGHISGAIILRAAASLTLAQSSLQGNHATLGGAIVVSEGSIARLEHCSLTDNAADTNGGALQVQGTRAPNRTDVYMLRSFVGVAVLGHL
jgi:hypothetical protein